ncbi:MAG TPA: universal stress protein [Solirubrobacteraceae bacterium]|nr:universal stress protein [Solirubrobacteraceae bacterium]
MRTVADELAPDEAAWLAIAGAGSSDRATAQDIARHADERNAEVVVTTVGDARFAAGGLLARGTAVLAVPPSWRPSAAGFARIAVGYDGSEPADAAVDATRALVSARRGVPRVDVVHVDDSDAGAGEVDGDVMSSRRTALIEWWLAQVGRPIPAPVGVIRRAGDPATVLAELSSDFDLFVIGTHGRGSLRRIMGAAVFKELIEATECPLLIVPRSRRRRSEAPLADTRQPIRGLPRPRRGPSRHCLRAHTRQPREGEPPDRFSDKPGARTEGVKRSGESAVESHADNRAT